MWKNYLITAVRFLRRQWLHTGFVVGGFTIGLACCFLILTHLSRELRFDTWHDGADRIFRVLSHSTSEGIEANVGVTLSTIAPAMEEDLPDVELYCRIRPLFSQRLMLRGGGHVAFTDQAALVDSTFFRMFSFPLARGHGGWVLRRPGTVVISHAMAQTLFPDENPLGKTVEISVGLARAQTFEIDGVLESPTYDQPSHIRLDVMFPMAQLQYRSPADHHDRNWQRANTSTYIKMRVPVTADTLDAYLRSLYEERGSPPGRGAYAIPLADVHLGMDHVTHDLNHDKGSRSHVQVMAAMAAILTLMTFFNYVNLSSAMGLRRIREAGIRKVLGARGPNVAVQLVAEGVLQCLLAGFLAVTIVELALPFTGIDLGRPFLHWLAGNPLLLLGAAAGVLGLGAASAAYPSLAVAWMPTVDTLKRFDDRVGPNGMGIRWALVGLQFGLSVMLVFGVITVRKQFQFMAGSACGYDVHGLARLRISGYDARMKVDTLRQKLLEQPTVAGVAAISTLPGETMGRYKTVGEHSPEALLTNGMTIAPGGIELLGLRLIEGRTFGTSAEDSAGVVVINRSLREALGYREAVGRTLAFSDGADVRTVIGVVEDFHQAPKRQPIEPTLFFFADQPQSNLLVRFSAGSSQEQGLAAVEEAWNALLPGQPLQLSFHSDEIRETYRNEERLLFVVAAFSAAAVLVACIGLVGLMGFVAEQRSREIGIRKVMGASVFDLVKLLTREALVVALVAGASALPLAWYLSEAWLAQFAFKTPLEPVWLLLPVCLMLALGWLSMMRVVWQAVVRKPVAMLRHE